MEQRSDEWFEVRLGKATASHFKDIVGTGANGKPLAGRKNYRAQLVIERLTGKTPTRFNTAAMGWGADTENLARLAYSFYSGNKVDQIGFVQHQSLMAGVSPDGLIADDGGLESKCLNTANHILVLKSGEVPSEHIPQIQGGMWVTGRKWWDFVSFDPDMPEHAQLFVKRVERDEDYINRLEEQVTIFLDEVDADMKFLEAYRG